ncbi:MAG: Precorrin-8X methylmutase [bacterium ADurb.Bin478]|nr:MAG: Precorrin-8X methylmutase [bacterium ADurb.Bin478]
MPETIRVEMKNITKSFTGNKANDRVNLTLRGGEVHVVLGENGAGKSTLMNILAGIYRPDEGEINIDGVPVAFSSPRDAISNGINAIRSGCRILTDVQMTAVGISQPYLQRFSCSVRCAVAEPETALLARQAGITRSAAAIRRMAGDLKNSIVALGNAPTALFEVLSQVQKGYPPALVVGVPVGFVNAAESKAALSESDLSYITVRGRKGGSTVAVAIMNALLRLTTTEAHA